MLGVGLDDDDHERRTLGDGAIPTSLMIPSPS
jgi:hypothetical protein